MLFCSVFSMGYFSLACLLLVFNRKKRLYEVLGWPLILVGLSSTMSTASVGVARALLWESDFQNVCLTNAVFFSLVVPFYVTPIFLAVGRVWVFMLIEKHKTELAKPRHMSETTALKLHKKRELLAQPFAYAAVVAAASIPAVIVLLVLGSRNAWVVDPGQGNLGLPAVDSSQACTAVGPVVPAAYLALVLPLFLAFAMRLYHLRENFGIRLMVAKSVFVVGVAFLAWIPLALLGIYEHYILAIFMTMPWPYYAVYVPYAQDWAAWSSKNATVIDAATRLPFFLSSSRSISQSSLKSWNRSSRRLSMQNLVVEVTLATVMGDPKMLEDFSRFLKAEFSVENLLFLQAAQGYRAAPSLEDALELIGLYVLENAPLQVNVSDGVRKRLVEFSKSNGKDRGLRPPGTDIEMVSLTEQHEEDLFAEAEAEITHLLEFDSLRRFLTAKHET
eukprot:TRINITY_DN527_c0_g1_i23.p1 TRINITY_DN527_c0_g1~~TRINITY_DN527_c0_g1_i23.p1  ORF type:complete len:446 (-),score=70.39 TRINITY_DN527_c0_g1_i23:35-1372(-)